MKKLTSETESAAELRRETNAILAKAPVINDETQQDEHSASENKVSSSAPSSSENTGRENQREVGRKEKGVAKNGLPKLDNAIKARMHSIYSRANSLFAFMLWVLAAVTFACFLSTTFLDYSTNVEITVNNPRVRSIADYSSSSEKADLGMLDFSISGDFSKTFNWNVKQLFVYLVAEYETPENVSLYS
ncbi:signal peptidase subunit [Oesophagostomum dentatum]|uniref:Signal peptidase complex subunit 3 n=1 Tax=Oesophagostomum dentatum TaxID=61180 RepID=A0A0B1SK75_OESDE|nr:signal peptidase subunit [Oesophagostomum dentatum]